MRSLKQVLAVFLLAVLLAGMTPAAVFGAKNDVVKLTVSSTLFVMQGESSYLDVETSAAAEQHYQLLLTSNNKNISISGNSGVLAGNAKHTFTITADRKTETGYYDLTLKVVDPSNPTNVLQSRTIGLNVTDSKNSYSSATVPAMEVSYVIRESENLEQGKVNNLRIYVYNRGNQDLRNSRVSITVPSGVLSIQSGSTTRNVGTISMGKTVYVDYPIIVADEAVTGSYPIEVKLDFQYNERTTETTTIEGGTKEETKYTLRDKNLTETIYVPVIGKEKEGPKDESVPLLIIDSFDYGNGNGILKRDADFNLKMTFLNTGSKDIHNVVISVLDNAGLVVPTGSSFIKIDSIKAGEKVDGSIGLRTVKDADITQTSLAVDMKYLDPDNKQVDNTYPIVVIVEKKPDESKSGGVANPILMVTNYSFGSDKAVMANSQFPLSLTITNTSAKTLRNIKVTVQDSTGSILPAEGSNSFFINSIAAGGSYGKLMPMAVSNDIKAGVSTIAVNMSYEDMDAHTFTSSDTITVPVTLQDRLVIDDVLDPGYLVAGEMGYAQIKYYNMGQTTLNNLRIAVSGDFTIDGDSSQYVGNMANGRSDYFSFNFMPNSEGDMNGKAVFTYENAQGEEQVIEKEFTFNIQPAPEFNPEDMDFPVEEEKHGFAALPIWGKGLVALGALLAVILAIKGIKKHKKAKAEALTLDE